MVSNSDFKFKLYRSISQTHNQFGGRLLDTDIYVKNKKVIDKTRTSRHESLSGTTDKMNHKHTDLFHCDNIIPSAVDSRAKSKSLEKRGICSNSIHPAYYRRSDPSTSKTKADNSNPADKKLKAVNSSSSSSNSNVCDTFSMESNEISPPKSEKLQRVIDECQKLKMINESPICKSSNGFKRKSNQNSYNGIGDIVYKKHLVVKLPKIQRLLSAKSCGDMSQENESPFPCNIRGNESSIHISQPLLYKDSTVGGLSTVASASADCLDGSEDRHREVAAKLSHVNTHLSKSTGIIDICMDNDEFDFGESQNEKLPNNITKSSRKKSQSTIFLSDLDQEIVSKKSPNKSGYELLKRWLIKIRFLSSKPESKAIFYVEKAMPANYLSPVPLSKPLMKPPSLKNRGVNCYLNSAFQAISSCTKFVDGIIRLQTEFDHLNKLRTFKDLIEMFTRGDSKLEITKNGAFRDWNKSGQQDSYELLAFVLNQVYSELRSEFQSKGIIESRNLEQWLRVQLPLRILMDFEIKCECGNAFTTPIQSDLAFHVTMDTDIDDLQSLLNQFFAVDPIDDYNCDNMKCYGKPANRVVRMREPLPDTICIHLQRTKYKSNKIKKIKDKISFSNTVTIRKEFCKRNDLPGDNGGVGTDKTYSLRSVIVHSGGVSSGHYICYKLFQGDWYYTSDSNIHKVSWEKVRASQAYILFFEGPS